MALTPLPWPISEVMAAAKAQNLLKWSNKMKSSLEKRDWEKYCRFHWDHGHNTEDCFRLKMAIEKLIERGLLANFVANDRQLIQVTQLPEHQQPLGNINIVSSGTSGGRDSQSARKKHARASRADIVHVRPADHIPSDTLKFSADNI